MRIQLRRNKTIVMSFALVSVCGLIGFAGCDLGLEDSANRYETLNLQTKELLDVLRQVTNEETAKAHLSQLEEVAGKVRETQKKINESAEKQAEKGGGGMSRITNHRQAGMFVQTADSARRQAERIREADAKAGAIVDKALEGIEFPEVKEGSPISF